jgi:predicted DNA-binding protein with PD1-like motif
MKHRIEPDGTVVANLQVGDSFRGCIERLCADLDIWGAQVTAIGAFKDPELGCWDVPTRTYDRRTFDGVWELLSLSGNITRRVDAAYPAAGQLGHVPFLHAHVTISGHDYQVFGGHLFDAVCGVVVETFIRPLSSPLDRDYDDSIGLPCWIV